MNIATHNSATGEKGGGLLSFLVAPFSICQSKTLVEQYNHGCRYFDFRVRWNEDRESWYFAHGFWESKESFHTLAKRLYEHVKEKNNNVFVMLTYEGDCDADEIRELADLFEQWFPKHFTLTTVNIKKPHWRTIITKDNLPHKNCYRMLDGRSWHTYIPIPWLWAKIFPENYDYEPYLFNFIDFL